MSEAGIVKATCTKIGFHDASGGALPTSTNSAGDYWVISSAGTITGVGTFTKGDIILSTIDGANSSDEWDLIEADEAVPNKLYAITGNPLAGGGLRNNHETYTGPLFRAYKAGPTTLDIYEDVDGFFDNGAASAFYGASPWLVDTIYSQEGTYHLTETDSAKMVEIVQVSGEYVFRSTGGRHIGNYSFVGPQSEATISVAWAWPTSGGSYTQNQAGLDCGDGTTSDTSGMFSQRWSVGHGVHVFAGSQLQTDIEHNDGSFYVSTFRWNGNDLEAFFNGTDCGSATLTAPPFGIFRLLKNYFADGDGYFTEWHVWDNDSVSPQVIYESTKAAYPGLFPSRTNLVVFEGDSITTSSFIDPNPSYPRTAALGAGLNHWEAHCRSGWTLSDLTTFQARMKWFVDNYQPTLGIAVIFAGTNDMLTVSAATAFSRLKDHAQWLKATGGYDKVAVIPCLPRGNSSTNGTFETKRLSYNSDIYADTSGDFDAVLDLTALALDTNGVQNSPGSTYFLDEVHLSTAGHTLLAGAVETMIEGML